MIFPNGRRINPPATTVNPANLSAISQTMGHATTKTIEEHYGRIFKRSSDIGYREGVAEIAFSAVDAPALIGK